MYIKPEFSDFYSHFLVTSGEMTSLATMLGHVTSFPDRYCYLLRVTVLYEHKHTQHPSFWLSTATSRLLPVK